MKPNSGKQILTLKRKNQYTESRWRGMEQAEAHTLSSVDKFCCFCSLFFLWVSRGKIKGKRATLSSGWLELSQLPSEDYRKKETERLSRILQKYSWWNKNIVGSKSEELLSSVLKNLKWWQPCHRHSICLFSRIRQQLIKKMLEKKTTSYNSHPATLENNHLIAQHIAKGLQPFSVLNSTWLFKLFITWHQVPVMSFHFLCGCSLCHKQHRKLPVSHAAVKTADLTLFQDVAHRI